MKRNLLVSALAAGLALSFAAGSVLAADKDESRVLVKFVAGGKGQAQQALKAAGARFHYTFDDIGVFAVSVPTQALDGLRRNPHIQYVENDQARHPTAQTVPYGIELVQARQVWDANNDGAIDPGATTGEGMLVCVIDSGLHAGHEDFAGVDVVGGYPKTWNYDNCGHGTHVAGTIAAANNDVGVVGVSPGKVSLYIVKVFGGDTTGQCAWTLSSVLIDAANRCAAKGARVINMSLGGDAPSQAEAEAFAQLNKRGVLSIAAAGNDGVPANATDPLNYPASYPSVVSVAALDQNKQLAGFSQKNAAVDLAAPGVAVLSTYPLGEPSPLISGDEQYPAIPMTNSIQATRTAPLVNGGLCNAPAPDTSWSGKVVLCQRGAATFLVKSQNVYNSGGVAAVIYNNTTGNLNGTLGTDTSVIPPIPVVGITQAAGQDLIAEHIGDSTTVDTVIVGGLSGYAYLSGTSMATPHVAGAAALIWSANPHWSNQQVREALEVTAEDLGTAGYDVGYGWGLIQAADALNYLQTH